MGIINDEINLWSPTDTGDFTDQVGGQDGTAFDCTINTTDLGENGSGAFEYPGNAGNRVATGTSNPFSTGDFSILFWMKFAVGAGTSLGIFGKYRTTTDDRTLRFTIDTGSASILVSDDGSGTTSLAFTSLGLSVDTWYHIAFTYEATVESKLYLDGVVRSPQAAPYATLHSSDAPLDIGVGFNSSSLQFDGLLDAVRIAPTAWGQTDIDTAASARNAGGGPPPSSALLAATEQAHAQMSQAL